MLLYLGKEPGRDIRYSLYPGLVWKSRKEGGLRRRALFCASAYSVFVVAPFSAEVVVAATSLFIAHFATFHVLFGFFMAPLTWSR